MSDLVVIVYPTEARAEEMRQKLFGLQKEYLIQISDAAIAVMHEGGKVKLNQLLNTTALGAASGDSCCFCCPGCSEPLRFPLASRCTQEKG